MGLVMTMIDLKQQDTLTRPPTDGWFPDPTGDHRMRYFDGLEWTEHVTHFGPQPCHGCGGEHR